MKISYSTAFNYLPNILLYYLDFYLDKLGDVETYVFFCELLSSLSIVAYEYIINK